MIHIVTYNYTMSAFVVRETPSGIYTIFTVEIVPSANSKSGFFSCYFLVPKRGGARLPRGLVLTVYMKDAYFHIHIDPISDRS